MQTCRYGAGAGKSCPGPFRRVGRQPMRSNEDRRKTAVVWQRNDDAQARCIRRCIEVGQPQPPYFQADGVAVRGALISQANSARWRSKRMDRRRGCVWGATAIDESSHMVRTDTGRRIRADKRTGTPATADPEARRVREGGKATAVRMRRCGRFRRSGELRVRRFAAGLMGRRWFCTPGRWRGRPRGRRA